MSIHLLIRRIGRLLYTTGDVEGAINLFLGLLKGTSSISPSLPLPGPVTGPNGTVAAAPPTQETQVNLDKIFLEDFRAAFSVSQPHDLLRTTLRYFDDSHSIGWKLRVGNWI